MSLFGSSANPVDKVTRISVFPKIGTVVLRKNKKLIVFNPGYLLGKHGGTSQEVASKFMNLRTATQLLELIDNHVSSGDLSGSKVEIKEMRFGEPIGTDGLVRLSEDLIEVLPIENVRGNNINIIYTTKGKIPKTELINMILVPFNPEYGQGVEKLFKEKYGDVGFEQFESVYAILTLFPGKYAPAMTDKNFWDKHALLKEMN